MDVLDLTRERVACQECGKTYILVESAMSCCVEVPEWMLCD